MEKHKPTLAQGIPRASLNPSFLQEPFVKPHGPPGWAHPALLPSQRHPWDDQRRLQRDLDGISPSPLGKGEKTTTIHHSVLAHFSLLLLRPPDPGVTLTCHPQHCTKPPVFSPAPHLSPPCAPDFESVSSLSLKDTVSVQFTPSALCVSQIWVSLGESVSELMVPVEPPCAAAEAGGHSVTHSTAGREGTARMQGNKGKKTTQLDQKLQCAAPKPLDIITYILHPRSDL